MITHSEMKRHHCTAEIAWDLWICRFIWLRMLKTQEAVPMCWYCVTLWLSLYLCGSLLLESHRSNLSVTASSVALRICFFSSCRCLKSSRLCCWCHYNDYHEVCLAGILVILLVSQFSPRGAVLFQIFVVIVCLIWRSWNQVSRFMYICIVFYVKSTSVTALRLHIIF